MASSSNMLQYYHRLSKGNIHAGPATITVTSETQKTISIEIFEYCHRENSSSEEFSMGNEVSIGGAFNAFDISNSYSNTFSSVSTKATQEGREIKTYQEEFTSDKTEITRELKDGEFLVHYVLIDLFCFTVNGGTKKHYVRVPRSDTIVEALDKDALDLISKGTIHLEKESFSVLSSRYPSINLDDIPVLARELTPLNIEVGLGTRKTRSHEESYSDRGTGSRQDLSVWKPRLFDNEFRILYIATRSRHYSEEVVVVTQGTYQGKPALAAPKHFECKWTDEKTRGDRDGSLWKAIPPSKNYVALSDVAVHRSNNNLYPGVTKTAHEIDSKFMCVLKSLCDVTELGDNPIWTDAGSGGKYDGATWPIKNSPGMRVSRGGNDRPSHQQYKLK